jgi:DNA-binding beta-propeller fold protein YncE
LSPIKLAYPHGIAVDTEGNVYVADTGDARIVKISSGGDLTVLAGQGKRTNSDGGPATEARLQAPWGLVRDTAGRIYFSDGPLIRCINIDGTLTTIAGGGSAAFSDGAAAADAGFLMPFRSRAQSGRQSICGRRSGECGSPDQHADVA